MSDLHFLRELEYFFTEHQPLINRLVLLFSAGALALLIIHIRTLRDLLAEFRQELNLSALLSRLVGVSDSAVVAHGTLSDFLQAISDVVWNGAQAKYVATFQIEEGTSKGFIVGTSPRALIAYFASDHFHQVLWKEEPLVFKLDSDKVQGLLKGQSVILRDLSEIVEPGPSSNLLQSLAREWRVSRCFVATFMVAGKPFGGFICGISRRRFTSAQFTYLDRVQHLCSILLESLSQREARNVLLESLTRKQDRLRLLNLIAQAINASQDRSSLIRDSLQRLEQLYPDLPVCILLSEDSSGRYSRAGSNSACFRYVPGGGSCPDSLTFSPEVARQIADLPAHSILRLPSSAFPPPFNNLPPATVFPIATPTRRFGLCFVTPPTSASLSPEDIEFFQFFTDHLALGLQNAEITQSLQDAYEQLRRSQETMMRQESLRVLGQMASAITHDINNLLTPLFAYLELSLADPSLSEETRNYLKTAQTAAENMANIVQRMREFYRDVPSERLPINVQRLVRQAVLLTEPRWKSQSLSAGTVISVRTIIQPDLPEISGAEGELLQSLVNLILNAVEAMPDGGTLTIRAYRDPSHPAFYSRQKPCEAIVIEVRDEGVGMSPETLRRATEPFFTTKQKTGSGLGLSIVRSVVERHDGVMEIDSESGKGTVVRLLLPIIPGKTMPSPEPAASAPVAQTTSLRILVVDDEPPVLQAVSEMVRKNGHTVLTAGSGSEALDILTGIVNANERLDLVISDLGMPGMDGATLARHIKSLSREIRIILLTGWGRTADTIGPLSSEIDAVIQKPVREADLLSAISSVFSPSL